MHRTRFVLGITALFLTAGTVVIAQHGQSGAPKPLHPTTIAPKAAPSSHSTSKTIKPTMATQAKTMKPASTPKTTTKPVSTSKTTKPMKDSSLKLVKTDKPEPAKGAKTEKSAPTKVAKTETTTNKTAGATRTAATTASATTTATVTLTPVQEKLKKNTNLAAKLTSRLPEGTDLMLASAGFRNLGQFVAAVNVSNNLPGISFTQLKTKMVTEGMSLGQAIQALKPVSSATVEAQRAEYDARSMITQSEAEPQATATTTTSVAASTKSKAKAKAKNPAQ